ncbi:MAG: hypothetical protein IJM23_05755 [Lachnospiraceae bacterium]|nr:hypothetical protein [Lachnospiraceae bacterium]
MAGYKKGEKEALLILQSMGIEMDESYHDDNSRDSMPDLRYADGRYIEVTHTLHNYFLYERMNDYTQLETEKYSEEWPQRHLDLQAKYETSYERLRNCDYEKTGDGYLTGKALQVYREDCNRIKSHMGYDPSEDDPEKQWSEFKCDTPIVQYSTDNILREVISKEKNHRSGDTDLFLFVTSEEYNHMQELLDQKAWNAATEQFLMVLYKSPFPVIYICSWNIYEQKYDPEEVHMVRLYKSESGVRWDWNFHHDLFWRSIPISTNKESSEGEG